MPDLQRNHPYSESIGYHQNARANVAGNAECVPAGDGGLFLVITPAVARALLTLLTAVHRRRSEHVNPTEET